GHAASRNWPYGHTGMGDGTKLDEMLRSLYDPFLDDHGGEVPSPFTPEGARLFLDWLGEQAHDARPGVSRALQHVYENRPDLQEAYPDLTGEEGRGLLRWAEEYGRREVPLLRRLMTRDDDVSEVASSARS